MFRLRPRFSLQTLLLITTIVAMAIVNVLLWREIGPLRAEVRQARVQLGNLWIDDESKVQAVKVRLAEHNLWRWRIYLPPGGRYRLLEFGGKLPPRAALSNRQWLEALRNNPHGGRSDYSADTLCGELTIEARISKQDGGWKFEVHPFASNSIYRLFEEDWLSDYPRAVLSDVSENRQTTFTPGEPVVLLHLAKPVRTPALSGSSQLRLSTDPAEGIVLILEQQPPTTAAP